MDYFFNAWSRGSTVLTPGDMNDGVVESVDASVTENLPPNSASAAGVQVLKGYF